MELEKGQVVFWSNGIIEEKGIVQWVGKASVDVVTPLGHKIRIARKLVRTNTLRDVPK